MRIKYRSVAVAIAALFAALAVFMACMQSAVHVYAGRSNVTILDNSFFENDLSVSYFYLDGAEGVTSQNGELVFTENTTESTYINSLRRADVLTDIGVDNCIGGRIVFRLTSLAPGAKFGISFGLERAYSRPQTANSTFIYLENAAGAYRICVDIFDDNADARHAAQENISLDVTAAELILTFSADIYGGLTVTLGGTDIYRDPQAGCAPGGYVGFACTGTAVAAVSEASVSSLSYDSPENTGDIVADFDSGEFNANEWTSQGHIGYLQPSSIRIEDGELKFENASEGIFSTLYAYSNFRLEMDITDIQREAEYDADGNLVYPISSWIGIAFGRTDSLMLSNAAINETPFLRFEPTYPNYITPAPSTNLILNNYGTSVYTAPMVRENNIWDLETVAGRAVNIRVTMLDGLLTVEMKYSDETEFRQLMHYDFGYTPQGCIQIWSMGNASFSDVQDPSDERMMQGNFSLDNIKIFNLDEPKTTVTVDYKSNIPDIPPDYEYEDTWNDDYLLGNRLEGQEKLEVSDASSSGCSGTLIAGRLWAVVPVLCAATFALAAKKRGN